MNAAARSLRRRLTGVALLAFALTCATARADLVTDWNSIAFDTFKAANVSGNPQVRALAILHVAMSDAVNTVQNRYGRHALKSALDPDASAEAAAISAASSVLVAIAPTQKARVDAAAAAALASLPDGAAKRAGIAIGEQAAASAIADRADDATNVPDTYRPVTAPGAWIPTTPPLFAEYARVKPWVLTGPDQFRPPPPPALTSAAYARDYNETKELGGAKSARRTAQQTEAVKFWSQPNLTTVWYESARQLGAARRLDLADNARLYALLSMAAANSFITDWDAKFQYNRWRPVTAIRNGDLDGNDATERDPSWTPFIDTPMHPEYPCAHCILSSAVGTVLRAEIGTGPMPTLTTTSVTAKGAARSWTKIDDFMQEVANARIYDGVHYRNSTEVGTAMGKQIGELVVAKYLRPLK